MKNVCMLVMAGLFIGSTIQAAELTADEIVAKANQAAYYAGNNGKANVKMVISDGRKREFNIIRLNSKNGLDRSEVLCLF